MQHPSLAFGFISKALYFLYTLGVFMLFLTFLLDVSTTSSQMDLQLVISLIVFILVLILIGVYYKPPESTDFPSQPKNLIPPIHPL